MIAALLSRLLYPWAARTAAKAVASREPDELIFNGAGLPYLRRWHVRRRWLGRFNVYVHQIRRDDDGRDLHDHPWHSLSVMVDGRMMEDLADGRCRICKSGDVIFRRARHLHRLRLYRDSWDELPAMPPRPVLTVFVTGPKIREWGFATEAGWVHWRDYLGIARPEAGT